MSKQERQEVSASRKPGAEMLLFLVISAIGIFALGNGLTGLFEPGKGIDLLWLAVAAVAIMILCAQMGRVHDSWPSRQQAAPQQAQSAPAEAKTDASLIYAEGREGENQ